MFGNVVGLEYFPEKARSGAWNGTRSYPSPQLSLCPFEVVCRSFSSPCWLTATTCFRSSVDYLMIHYFHVLLKNKPKPIEDEA